jgi:hypothetical protein
MAKDPKELEDQWASLGDNIAKIDKELGANVDKLIGAKSQQLSIQQDITKAMQLSVAAQKAGNKELADEAKGYESVLKKIKHQSKLNDRIAKQMSLINDQAQDLVGNIETFIKKLPGGNMLVKAFGIDKLGSALTTSLNKAAAVLAKNGSAGAALSAFSASAMALINPFTIVAAIIAGLALVFINFEKKAKGIAEATGLTLSQSKALVKEAKAASAAKGIELATSTDILAVQKATIKEFGIGTMLSGKQAANIADIGRSFGIGAEKAAAVTNEFMRMGMGGEDAKNSLLDVSAAALKAGVSVGTVTADIAANAKDVAKYFGGNVKSLKKAAVEAAKMGVSLKTMASVADGLLKFEDSIAAQFEFQAMTGKMINFDKARQLALDGKIAEATQEVLSNVGSLAEFDAMRPMAQRKLAAATGMTVDELTKSLAIQEKLGNGDEAQMKAAMALGLSASELAGMQPEQLKALLAQQEASGQIAKDFAVLKDELTAALIPAGKVLVQLFSAITPIVQGISLLLIPIVDAFTGLHGLITFSTEGLTNMQKILGTILGIYTAIKGVMLGQQAIQGVKLAMAAKEGGFAKKKQLLESKGLVKNIGMAVMKAFAFLGPILGAIAAIGITAMGYKFLNAGDVSIDPNGGPVVSSPREGTIFQGTKNDGVSMSPSHGLGGGAETGNTTPNRSSNTGGGMGSVAQALATTNALLRQILEQGTVIEMDGQLVGQVVRTADSYRRK